MLISQTIDDALVMIGVKNPIDEATPQDHEYGLRTLNRIIDSYNTQNLIITYLQDIAYQEPTVNNECETADPNDLVARKWNASVTIGHCQEINDEAPVKIESLFWRQSGTDYISKEMNSNQWAAIGWKTAEGIPLSHYVQRMDNNNIKIYFDLVPMPGLELHLLAIKPYTGKNSTGNEYLPTDDINWTFGFEKMLMYRLALELCPSYSVEVPMAVATMAKDAEDWVKTHNYRPLTLKADSTLSRFGRRGNSSRSNRARF